MVGVEVDTVRRSQWCCVSVLALLFMIGLGTLAEDCTITVQPGESIQAAIDAACEGAVICLAKGEWEEHLTIEKSLTLQGMDAERTVIKGLEAGLPVIHIWSKEHIGVTIAGVTVTGGLGLLHGHGLQVAGSANVTIGASTFAGNYVYGIQVRDSAQATISYSTFEGNELGGIDIGNSAQAALYDSTVAGNTRYGIAIADASQAVISDSAVTGNAMGIFICDSAQATITDSTIEGNEQDGIFIGDSAWATITDSIILANAWEGIFVRDSAEATIEGNVIRDNVGYGVALGMHLCFDTDRVFTGYVAGKGNTVGGNRRGNYCPEGLAFLFTEEGGEFDRRE